MGRGSSLFLGISPILLVSLSRGGCFHCLLFTVHLLEVSSCSWCPNVSSTVVSLSSDCLDNESKGNIWMTWREEQFNNSSWPLKKVSFLSGMAACCVGGGEEDRITALAPPFCKGTTTVIILALTTSCFFGSDFSYHCSKTITALALKLQSGVNYGLPQIPPAVGWEREHWLLLIHHPQPTTVLD